MDYIRDLRLWIHVGVWVCFLLVYIIIFGRFFSLELSLLRGLANLLPMVLIFYLNLYLVDRFFEQKSYGRFILANLLLLAAMVGLRVQLNLLFPDIDERVFLRNEERSWFFGALVTSIAILVVSTFYQILDNRYANERRNLAIIQEQQEAQLQFLRAQINPHFLFNTLHNIYSLAVARSDKTPDMVLRLSNLLRYVVYDGRSEQVELKREVQQIREYVELFRMRHEEPLDVCFEVEGPLDGVKMEPMILIPLVENAFKHCDLDLNEAAYAHFRLEVSEAHLQFTTLNTKDSRQQQKDKAGGVGLENIRRRLELKYPGRYSLRIDEQESTFGVSLHLQLKPETHATH